MHSKFVYTFLLLFLISGCSDTHYRATQIIAELDEPTATLNQNFRQTQREPIKQQSASQLEQSLIQADPISDDIPRLLQYSKVQQMDTTKWLFAVAIEKYAFTDPVVFSANSGNDFVSVAQKRLGVSKEHTRVLINEDASSAKINFYLKDMLAHVKEGDTVYFYYSGHGIPLPSQNNEPYMLTQDMNPAYMDDERFKLQNIYNSLSASKASKIIAFIDSCFSGGVDNKSLIKGVAATRVKPKGVTFNKSKMLVISAGSGTQYSNKYDDKTNRLFSYFVMKALINNNSDIQRLYDYVKSNVQEKSYEMGATYEQVPVYEGNIGMKL